MKCATFLFFACLFMAVLGDVSNVVDLRWIDVARTQYGRNPVTLEMETDKLDIRPFLPQVLSLGNLTHKDENGSLVLNLYNATITGLHHLSWQRYMRYPAPENVVAFDYKMIFTDLRIQSFFRCTINITGKKEPDELSGTIWLSIGKIQSRGTLDMHVDDSDRTHITNMIPTVKSVYVSGSKFPQNDHNHAVYKTLKRHFKQDGYIRKEIMKRVGENIFKEPVAFFRIFVARPNQTSLV